MPFFKLKPKTFEILSFDELVQEGRKQTGDVIPLSFSWKGQPITHEEDNHYLVVNASEKLVSINEGDMIVHEVNDGLRVISTNDFERFFEKA